ncbi:MAG: 2Fe-2S iron-sulfur cluster-binding protein [Sandaracinaceae bacterium]|nr:2Fe-2S iron-sulfur cluster-binding protein [Sandaracinaceae bacterium]
MRFEPIPPEERVVIWLDGNAIEAKRGEPVAMSLWAAGRLILSRSIKYHRPRGAYCFGAQCDGCLVRINGIPSQRSCRIKAEAGMEIETQNTLATALFDPLEAADWLFPDGLDHHRMFTWSKAANRGMQPVVRQLSGLGRLPEAPSSLLPSIEKDVDVLVIGAGPSGLACAKEASLSGLKVLCVEAEEEAGGRLRWSLDPNEQEQAKALSEEALRRGVELACGWTVLGIYEEVDEGRIAIASTPQGIARIKAKVWVCAVGRIEGSALFEGSDAPGVISSEGAKRLLHHRILPGRLVAIAGDLERRAGEMAALKKHLEEKGAHVEGPFDLSAIKRARGRKRIKSIEVEAIGQRIPCDALILAPRLQVRHEIPSQLGFGFAFQNGAFECIKRSPKACAELIGSAEGQCTPHEALLRGLRAGQRIVKMFEKPQHIE